MKESQYQLFANGINKIIELVDDGDLVLAGKACKNLGAILISWKVNGKTRVWKKSGEIKKKFKSK